MPAHEHQVFASGNDATVNTPANTVLPGKAASGVNLYVKESAAGKDFSFNAVALTNAGGSQAHNNVMPSRTLNYIICMTGMYPTRP